MRAVLWRLLLPYHEQIEREVDGRFQQATADVDARLQHTTAEVQARLRQAADAAVEVEVGLRHATDAASDVDARLREAVSEVDARFRQVASEVDARFRQVASEVDALRDGLAKAPRDEEALTRLNTRLSGLHKDQAALGHRLAGMEEVLRDTADRAPLQAALDAARAEAASADEAIRAWVKAVQADAANAADGLRAGLAELRGESFERLGRQATEADAIRRSLDRLTDRQAEAEDRLRALTERDWTLRAGDKVAVDGEGLTITSGPAGRFLVRAGDLVGGVVLSGQVWEPHVRAAIERHAQSGRTAVDVGAYIGLHTVHLGRFFREVLAFEPQEEIHRVLCANLVLNGCRNVRTRCEALYDGAPAMRLAPSEQQEISVPTIAGRVDYRTVSNAAALTFQPVQGDDADAVPARTLDSLGLKDLGFLKIDAQGADLAVLRGGRDTIERCRPVIAFEYERGLGAQHGATLEGLEAFFDALGYRLEILADTNPGLQADYLALPG